MSVTQNMLNAMVKNKIEFVTTVPCKQLSGIIELLEEDDEILHVPSNKEDEGMGLWENFNKIQKNIINGNFQYKTRSGKIRQARIIKNFKQDLQLNRDMFAKALEYAA